MMNAIPDNRPGPTMNPLLMVNMGQDGNTNSFITPTLVTSHQNCQGNGNTVAFENTIPETDKQINARLVEIANQGPTLETSVTSQPGLPHSGQTPVYKPQRTPVPEYVHQSKQILQ